MLSGTLTTEWSRARRRFCDELRQGPYEIILPSTGVGQAQKCDP